MLLIEVSVPTEGQLDLSLLLKAWSQPSSLKTMNNCISMGGLAVVWRRQPTWLSLLAQLWGLGYAAKGQAQHLGAAASSTTVAFPVGST